MAGASPGKRIRLRRQAMKLTQQQLADRVGVDRATVSAWENDRHLPERNEGAIEEALGISLSGDEPELDYDRADEAERGIGEDPSLSLQQKRYLLGQIRSARQEPSERARKRPA